MRGSKLNLEPTPMIGAYSYVEQSRARLVATAFTHSFSVTQVKLAASSVLPLPL